MKVRYHKRKNKYAAPTYTIQQIDRDELSLIVSFAIDGIKAYPGGYLAYKGTLDRLEALDKFLEGDEMSQLNGLET